MPGDTAAAASTAAEGGASMTSRLQSTGEFVDAACTCCAASALLGGSCLACACGKEYRDKATHRATTRWNEFQRKHWRAAKAIGALIAALLAALFVLDIFTDIQLTLEVAAETEPAHPVWTALLVTFLVLGYGVAWLYLIYFVYVTAEKGNGARDVLLALLFGLPALALLDVVYLLTAFPGVEDWMYKHRLLPDRARLLMVTYKSLRPLTESFFESVPQLVLQPVAPG